MVTTVGVVDDSIIVRSALEQIINSDPEFEVIGKASDPFEAREMILEDEPDLITLDVEMPQLDGITFLERIMEHHPLPVVMVSSLTESTSRKGMKALELGAIDVVGKPSGDSRDSIQSLKDDLMPKLRAAARSSLSSARSPGKPKEDTREPEVTFSSEVNLIVIGASTGGTNALKTIFKELPDGLPPILIAQHMPPVFTGQFSEHLDEISPVSVFEAEEEGYVERSEAVLAEGDHHLLVDSTPRGNRVHYSISDDEKVCFQRPAVDPLFNSAAQYGKEGVVGVILTGMGKDGLDGSRSLSEAGATILVQDEASCTVYGMPKQVKENVKESREVPLDQIGPVLAQLDR